MISATPDQLSTLGAYVAREWGDYGYRFEQLESPTFAVTVGRVVCSDGGRFSVAADRYGNARALSEDETTAAEEIAAMHENATAL